VQVAILRLVMTVRPHLRYAAADSPPSLPSTSSAAKNGNRQRRPLPVNSASLAWLIDLFEPIQGLGELSARSIIDERNVRGPFADLSDLSRRFALLPYTLLSLHFELDFTGRPNAEERQCGSASSTTDISDVCRALETVRVTNDLPGIKQHGPPQVIGNENAPQGFDRHTPQVFYSHTGSTRAEDEEEPPSVTFAAWNCARMSTRSPNFAKKCGVLERMVADTPDLCVILLQEVVACAMEHVAERLRTITADPGWTAVGCGSSANRTLHAHPRVVGMTCQTALYNASKVACLADSYLENDNIASMVFKRAPHICIFQSITPRASLPAKLLCVANCHILQRAPEQELHFLPELVQAMRVACGHAVRREGRPGLQRNGEVIYVVAGDFNRGSESADFARLREEEDYVELVQSPRQARAFGRIVSEAPEDDTGETAREVAMRYLTDATTRGGQHIDNVWMHRRVRCADLMDAWQYVPGGNGRSLHESGYASAGRVRSERSDHVPIVVKLRLGKVQDPCRDSNDRISDTLLDSWVLKKKFEVVLNLTSNTWPGTG
jgi:hypothetical protein